MTVKTTGFLLPSVIRPRSKEYYPVPLAALKSPGSARRILHSGTAPLAPCPGPLMGAEIEGARGVGLPRRNNSTGLRGETPYLRAEHIMEHQDGYPHLRSALRKPSEPTANQVPPTSGPALLALPKRPHAPRNLLLCFGSTCRRRAPWLEAAGAPGWRRPGKPRRAPCPSSVHGA